MEDEDVRALAGIYLSGQTISVLLNTFFLIGNVYVGLCLFIVVDYGFHCCLIVPKSPEFQINSFGFCFIYEWDLQGAS